MNKTYIIIYAKDNKIIALDYDKAKQSESELISKGWKHTATLNLCDWIENLCNNLTPEQQIVEIKSLKK